jgi:UDP-N-acetylmuramate--alanine ligase
MVDMHEDAAKDDSYHFVGIGGIGMSAIAKYLHDDGCAVTGSDVRAGATVASLRARSIAVAIGHRAENIARARTVVFSNAVPHDNPELVSARAGSRNILSRADLLGRIVAGKRSIGLAGSHGKTTVSAMVCGILVEAGMDPSAIIGGRFGHGQDNYRRGHSDWLVFEACEGYRSITRFSPQLACITNIDREHIDHYDSFDDLQDAFVGFANRAARQGGCVLNGDDEIIRRLLPRIHPNRLLFGQALGADIRIADVHADGDGTTFTATMPSGRPEGFRLPLPGTHNVYNAVAAIGTAVRLGIPVPTIGQALASYRTVARRFEVIGRSDDRILVDDYAHHPTEIERTLSAARQWAPKRRLVVVFQPHLFSRTATLAEEFARALAHADQVLLCPIYPARESPVEGVTSRLIQDHLVRQGYGGHRLCPTKASMVEEVLRASRPNDLLLFMGAGDIHESSRAVLHRLREQARSVF